jgi:hypothetical protein
MKDIRQNWKALAADRKIKSEDIAALCIYRALVKEQGIEGALSRLRKSFKSITNPIKLANGADPDLSLKNSLWSTKYSAFKDWLPEEEFKQIWEMAHAIRKDLK